MPCRTDIFRVSVLPYSFQVILDQSFVSYVPCLSLLPDRPYKAGEEGGETGNELRKGKKPQIKTVPTGPKPECSLTSDEESPTATDQCNHAKENRGD